MTGFAFVMWSIYCLAAGAVIGAAAMSFLDDAEGRS